MKTLEKLYTTPQLNRQYWLADAVIRIRSYSFSQVDAVASFLTDEQVATFHEIVNRLNDQQ